MTDETKGTTSAASSAIPAIRRMVEMDQAVLDQLYDKMCPGRRTNLSPNGNAFGVIVERNGRISAAVIGGIATIAHVVLVLDPDTAASPDAAHDSILALDTVTASLRNANAVGDLLGQVVLVPKRPSALGEVLDQSGWFRENENLAAHVSVFVNEPLGAPPARS